MKTITVTLTQDAFLDDDGDYSARAELSQNDIDNTDNGNESGYPANYALVRWNTLESWDGEDGGDACDWGKPEGIKLNNKWIADGLEGVTDFTGHNFVIA
jgi:hypothetical protein